MEVISVFFNNKAVTDRLQTGYDSVTNSNSASRSLGSSPSTTLFSRASSVRPTAGPRSPRALRSFPLTASCFREKQASSAKSRSNMASPLAISCCRPR